MSPISVHQLSCPRCGVELQGLVYDKVFYCVNCQGGMIVHEGQRQSVSVTFAKPVCSDSGDRFVLPFWHIKGRVRIEGATSAQQFAVERLKEITSVWVSAFLTIRRETYGDLGERLTTRRAEVQLGGTAQLLVGTTRSMAEAVRYGELQLTDTVDKQADVTGMSLTIVEPVVTLWGLPFVRQDDQLTDLILGERFPVAAIPDLADILEATRKG